jgi:chemotaxis protein methyltransferase CheR
MAAAGYVSHILPENYRVLQSRVYEHTGIVLGTDKEYLLDLRLSGILSDLGLSSINDLCRLLQQERSSQISQRVAEAMTTNETYFFREPAHYELIRKALLPRLACERKKSRALRFWSAACSTGQEAYSLAMLLLQEPFADWDIKILGSDYSVKVVERARKGLYQQVEVNRGVPANLLLRYFERAGLEWRISDAVRRMCTFETRDLRQPARNLGPFEMVFCRNVMIYFDPETKAAILRNLHGTLVRGGWLLLGGAEASLESPEYFDKQRIDGVTVYVAR